MDGIHHFLLLGVFLGIVSIIAAEAEVNHGAEAEAEQKNDLRRLIFNADSMVIMIFQAEVILCVNFDNNEHPEHNDPLLSSPFHSQVKSNKSTCIIMRGIELFCSLASAIKQAVCKEFNFRNLGNCGRRKRAIAERELDLGRLRSNPAEIQPSRKVLDPT